MKKTMRWMGYCTGAFFILGMASAQQTSPRTQAEDKLEAAKTQIKTLERAIEAYRIKNKGKYPEKLKALVDEKFVKSESLDDPWKKLYEYDPAGKRNNGKKPDIWTVTPDKKTVGNWPDDD